MNKASEPVYSGTHAETAFNFFKNKIWVTAPDKNQGCFHVSIADADERIPPLLSGHWNKEKQELYIAFPIKEKKQAVEMQFSKFFALEVATVDYNKIGNVSDDEMQNAFAQIDNIVKDFDEKKVVLALS